MKTFLLAAIFSLLFGACAQADLKIGVVDTSKAFDAYYKTRDTAARIAAKEGKFTRDVQSVQAEYQEAGEEAQALANAVKDTSLPTGVRKSKDTALAYKVQDLKALEKELTEMSQQRKAEIHDELVRSHQEISEQIVRAIASYGERLGYDLILDCSAEPESARLSKLPFRTARVFDLTETIITQLNASEPRSSTQSAAAH